MNNEVVGSATIYSLGILLLCMGVTGENTRYSIGKEDISCGKFLSFFYVIKEEKLSTGGKDRLRVQSVVITESEMEHEADNDTEST